MRLPSMRACLIGGTSAIVLVGAAWVGAILWPDHAAAAREAFDRTRLESAQARDVAWLRQDEAATLDLVLERTDRIVAEAEAFAGIVPISRSVRRHLARAKLAQTEARALHRQGVWRDARLSALDALVDAQEVVLAARAVASRYSEAATLRQWRQWADETRAWSRRTGRPAIVVSKADRRVTLYVAGRAVRTYPADLGSNWMADKVQAGDGATPEGRYRIVARNDRSQYYKALLIDYPNAQDRLEFARAKRAGHVPAGASPGGLIEIHGQGGREQDWTLGCVALSDAHIDDLFARVAVGTPVTIVGALDRVTFTAGLPRWTE